MSCSITHPLAFGMNTLHIIPPVKQIGISHKSIVFNVQRKKTHSGAHSQLASNVLVLGVGITT